MSIGITILWVVIALGIFGFTLFRYIKGRKDTKTAREEYNKRGMKS